MPKKELHLYELFLLFKFTNVQATVQDKINFYRTLIKENGSRLMIKNNGKKSLAYPIKGFETATYVQLVYVGNEKLTKRINIEIQRDESVLRGLTTKLMDKSVHEKFNY